MTVVHHLNNSRSQRILWLLEKLGLHEWFAGPAYQRALEKGGKYDLLR